MAVRHGGAGAVEVTDGDVLVASAQPAGTLDPAGGIPRSASFPEAEAVGESYEGLARPPLPDLLLLRHRPRPGDGLRLRPGRVPGREGGATPPRGCPAEVDARDRCGRRWTAPGAGRSGIAGRPMVLGTMTAQVDRAPRGRASEHVVMAWRRGSEGRKHY